MRTLRVEDLTATAEHLYLALSAASLATAGRGQEDAVGIERRHQAVALGHCEFLVTVDCDGHVTAGREIFLRDEQDNDQKENRSEKDCDTY